MSLSRLLLCLTLVLSVSYSVFAQSKDVKIEKPSAGYFPVCGQLSPLPAGKGWKSGSGPLDKQTLRDTIDNLRQHGFSGLEMRIDLPQSESEYLREYALEQGMFLVTHAGAIEGFGRDNPPKPSVYSPDYAKKVRARAESALASTKNQKGLRYVFTFQDEPFHAGVKSFGNGKFEKQEFKRRYGYDLPDDPQSVRDDPRRWLDVINFHSDNYPDGWRQTYKAIKAVNPSGRDSITGSAWGRDFNFKTVSTRSCTPDGGEVLLKTAAGKPALLRRKVDKGQVFLLGFCTQDTYFQMWEDKDAAGRADLRELISTITKSCGVRPHVWSSNPEIEAAVRANRREGFLFIINHETKLPDATIRIADLPFPIAKIIDLADGKAVEFSEKNGVVELSTSAGLGETRLMQLQAKQ